MLLFAGPLRYCSLRDAGQAYNGFTAFDEPGAHLVPEPGREEDAMLGFDAEKVAENARKSPTEDLLDRVTIYRGNLEPEAIPILEQELERRGVSAAEVAAHRERQQGEHVTTVSGYVLSCSLCRRPAVAERWGWHWLWGVLPVFPRRMRLCQEHLAEREGKG
jgi:hypothetical protein